MAEAADARAYVRVVDVYFADYILPLDLGGF